MQADGGPIALNPDGTVMLVEPFAIDSRPRNIAENPMAALFGAASSASAAR